MWDTYTLHIPHTLMVVDGGTVLWAVRKAPVPGDLEEVHGVEPRGVVGDLLEAEDGGLIPMNGGTANSARAENRVERSTKFEQIQRCGIWERDNVLTPQNDDIKPPT